MYRRIGVLICRHPLKQTLDFLKFSLVTTMITIVQARLPTEKCYFFYLSLGAGPIDCLSEKHTFVFFPNSSLMKVSSHRNWISIDKTGKIYCLPIIWNHPTSGTVLPHSWQYSKDLSWPSGKLLCQQSLLSCHAQPREYRFPQLSQRQCCTFALISFHCGPSLYANYHLKPKRQSYQPMSGL